MAITAAQKRPSEGMLLSPPAAVSGNPRSVTAPVGPLQLGGTTLQAAQRVFDLHLPWAHRLARSAVHMDAVCARAMRSGSRHYDALNLARCAVDTELISSVVVLRDSGCLLHFTAPALVGLA